MASSRFCDQVTGKETLEELMTSRAILLLMRVQSALNASSFSLQINVDIK
jgi:hypothetical protein